MGAGFPTPVGEPAGHAVPGQRAGKSFDRIAAENRLVSKATMLLKDPLRQSQKEAGDEEGDKDVHDSERTKPIGDIQEKVDIPTSKVEEKIARTAW